MRQFSATLKNDVGIGLRKIVACSHSSSQCLLVSAVFGTVSSLLIFILVSLIFFLGLALTLACGEMPYIVCALHVQKIVQNFIALSLGDGVQHIESVTLIDSSHYF